MAEKVCNFIKKRFQHTCMLTHEDQTVFANDSYFKSEFHVLVQFEF